MTRVIILSLAGYRSGKLGLVGSRFRSDSLHQEYASQPVHLVVSLSRLQEPISMFRHRTAVHSGNP